MDDNVKTYSVVGTVTIGSDEYKDLITECVTSKKDADHYRSEYWREQSKASDFQKQVASLSEELGRYKKYIKENGEQDKMELWILKVNREG